MPIYLVYWGLGIKKFSTAVNQLHNNFFWKGKNKVTLLLVHIHF